MLKLYLVFDRSGRFLFEQPAASVTTARDEAKERDPRAVTVYLKTPHNAHQATGYGREVPINTIGHAFIR